MVTPAYWFPREEYLARVERIRAKLSENGLDALVAFLPETVTYLTGFFTRGYSSFQFAIIPVTGDPVLFCRDVEEYYLDATCVFPKRVMWTDSDDRNAVAARAIHRCARFAAADRCRDAGVAPDGRAVRRPEGCDPRSDMDRCQSHHIGDAHHQIPRGSRLPASGRDGRRGRHGGRDRHREGRRHGAGNGGGDLRCHDPGRKRPAGAGGAVLRRARLSSPRRLFGPDPRCGRHRPARNDAERPPLSRALHAADQGGDGNGPGASHRRAADRNPGRGHRGGGSGGARDCAGRDLPRGRAVVRACARPIPTRPSTPSG